MFTKKRIKEEIEKGHIKIDPYNEEQLGPNSYNVKLSDELMIYTVPTLDMAKDNPTEMIKIPKRGLLLEPGLLYLGRTVERTEAHGIHISIDGRSSTGRLGLNVHCTAGVGDNHFRGYWTFEFFCIQPVIIYPFVEVGQLCFTEYEGAKGEDIYTEPGYNGKYQDNNGIQKSMLYKELQKKGIK